jgi:hypothetical protein
LKNKNLAAPNLGAAVSKAVTAWACAETSANMGRDWHGLCGKEMNNPHSQKRVFR